jgi:AcrR family transcriptional regulator
MARILNEQAHTARRNQILDAAIRLSVDKGYDNMAIQDLLEFLSISKGAFYHYFLSKEALLEALAERFARQAFTDIQSVINRPGLDPLARLNAFLAASRQCKLDMAPQGWAVFGALFRQENQLLYQRIAAAWEALFKPVLTKLIAQGVKERVFDTFDPEGVGEMLQHLVSTVYPIVASAITAPTKKQRQYAILTFEKRLRLHGIVIDRILGLPDGSVHIIEPGYARSFMATVPWHVPDNHLKGEI